MQRYFIKNNYRQNDIIIADDSMYAHGKRRTCYLH